MILWQSYSLDMTRDQVRQRFREKYGRDPHKISKAGATWIAGPVGARQVEVLEVGPRTDNGPVEQQRLGL